MEVTGNAKFNFMGYEWRENRASQYLETVSIDLNIVPQPFSPPAPPDSGQIKSRGISNSSD